MKINKIAKKRKYKIIFNRFQRKEDPMLLHYVRPPLISKHFKTKSISSFSLYPIASVHEKKLPNISFKSRRIFKHQ